jgi:hypothetical protein
VPSFKRFFVNNGVMDFALIAPDNAIRQTHFGW